MFLICGIPSESTHMSPPAMAGALWFMCHHLSQDAGTTQPTQLSVADSIEHMLHVTALVQQFIRVLDLLPRLLRRLTVA